MIKKNPLFSERPYVSPMLRISDCRIEYSFLLSNPTGSIPALEEDDTYGDPWA